MMRLLLNAGSTISKTCCRRSFSQFKGIPGLGGAGTGSNAPDQIPQMPDMSTLMKDPAMMAAAKEMMANPSMMAAAMKVMEDPAMQRSISAMAASGGKMSDPAAMPDMSILHKFMSELEQIEKAKADSEEKKK